ncbi:zinc finger and BTB domain-containing protein 45 [Orussus abietinus]|uniref:zinc finger and BTB domain-containing protein 45 n=1 Tax=Orussus abietinus TaxID=222816 RepID=UPI000C715F8F|nr:zinc finger and BTB domain-containing protein 45 [Orussus abietinus]
MYSLYRAWFGAGTAEESYPRMETLSPPDTLVRVGNEGEHQFVAHRGVLAAHSGYLKALLATATSSTAPSAAGSADPAAPVTSVSVSSVGGEAFAPLLNYMYTGHLEVTLDNIYSVLLATHLLHMPGALEQCRAALSRLRAPPPLAAPPPTPTPTSAPRAGSVLRPVPNRVVAPPLCWPQPTLYPSVPVSLSHLPNLQIPGAISAVPSLIHEARSSVPYR